jgi:hypothetical protein
MKKAALKKKKPTGTGRVYLSKRASERVNHWIEQIRRIYPGIRLEEKDLVDWLIMRKRISLSPLDLSSLQNRISEAIGLALWAFQDRQYAIQRRGERTLAE